MNANAFAGKSALVRADVFFRYATGFGRFNH